MSVAPCSEVELREMILPNADAPPFVPGLSWPPACTVNGPETVPLPASTPWDWMLKPLTKLFVPLPSNSKVADDAPSPTTNGEPVETLVLRVRNTPLAKLKMLKLPFGTSRVSATTSPPLRLKVPRPESLTMSCAVC